MRRVPQGRFVDTVSADMKQLLTQHRQGVAAMSDVADVITSTAYTLNGIVFPHRGNQMGSVYDDFINYMETGDMVGVQQTIIPAVLETPFIATKDVYNSTIQPVVGDVVDAAGNAITSVLQPVTTTLIVLAIIAGLVVFYPEIRGTMKAIHGND